MWQWTKALLSWITKYSQNNLFFPLSRSCMTFKELFSLPLQSRDTLSHSCHISQWDDCGNEKSAVMSLVRSWHFPTFRIRAINLPTLTNLSYCRSEKMLSVRPFLSGLSFSSVLWTPLMHTLRKRWMRYCTLNTSERETRCWRNFPSYSFYTPSSSVREPFVMSV